ncbi:MAG: hypothetical protein RLZZ403_470 [Pseudomonadota bacterium]|jgi:hypothetical protein
MSSMGFERALAAMKAGLRVARAGWNGKGMHLRLLEGVPTVVREPLTKDELLGTPLGYGTYGSPVRTQTVVYPRHIAMWTATGDVVPWLASVTDLMAEDWMVVEIPPRSA